MTNDPLFCSVDSLSIYCLIRPNLDTERSILPIQIEASSARGGYSQDKTVDELFVTVLSTKSDNIPFNFPQEINLQKPSYSPKTAPKSFVFPLK